MHEELWGTRLPVGWTGFWLRIARPLSHGRWPLDRLALLARRAARLRPSGPVDVELWGLRLRLYPDRSVSEARILFLPGSWDRAERRLLASWSKPGFTFVDIGANVGAYSFWILSLMDPAGRVVAVEPNPDLARQLRFNVRSNRAEDRMRVVEAAVGASPGPGTLLVNASNSGESRMADQPDAPDPHRRAAPAPETRPVPVTVATLLQVVREAGLDRIDCLKIDVEGREAAILKRFLRDAPPSLWPARMIVELKTAAARPGAAAARRPGLPKWQMPPQTPAKMADDPAKLADWLASAGYEMTARTKLNGVFRLRPRP